MTTEVLVPQTIFYILINKNGIPFHDRERITNFQKYHENSNNPNRKVRRKENIPIRQRKIFQLEKGNHSNKKKENIPIRKRKIFQLEKGKHSN